MSASLREKKIAFARATLDDLVELGARVRTSGEAEAFRNTVEHQLDRRAHVVAGIALDADEWVELEDEIIELLHQAREFAPPPPAAPPPCSVSFTTQCELYDVVRDEPIVDAQVIDLAARGELNDPPPGGLFAMLGFAPEVVAFSGELQAEAGALRFRITLGLPRRPSQVEVARMHAQLDHLLDTSWGTSLAFELPDDPCLAAALVQVRPGFALDSIGALDDRMIA